MCKEMPVIPVNKVVDPKRIIADPKKKKTAAHDNSANKTIVIS
jgi:hypothetical protein